ncbi:MAG: hypothetical protein HY318_17980 [Armatimonadetes bacterium]|nr:hypothetical protein [Armatimonadota bacterium]
MPTYRPKIACIGTEYRENSHVDVILTKFLEGCRCLDVDFEPQVDIVSLYLDQYPENDMGRDMAGKHGVPIHESISSALTLGGDQLAVDGVLLIGEHGNYPFNEKGQHLYPRRRFLEETAAVFESSGRSVPVFSDKHLSYSWENAKWMYDKAIALGIPFMAGSSLPVTWRRPELELALGVETEEAMAVGYGGLEAYGFHALETLQCMVERRRGGESGVRSVQLLSGNEVWQAGDEGRWSWELLQAALATSESNVDGEVRSNVEEPEAFMIEYRDGLRASVLMLNGQTADFLFSAKLKGQREPVATEFWLQPGKPYTHFAKLDEAVQQMFLTGAPSYPVERTLLTTGILAVAMDSKFAGGTKRDTCELEVKYEIGG